jgi:hypothetical protein
MRHPPENAFVFLSCISGVKLRPCKATNQNSSMLVFENNTSIN